MLCMKCRPKGQSGLGISPSDLLLRHLDLAGSVPAASYIAVHLYHGEVSVAHWLLFVRCRSLEGGRAGGFHDFHNRLEGTLLL